MIFENPFGYSRNPHVYFFSHAFFYREKWNNISLSLMNAVLTGIPPCIYSIVLHRFLFLD